MKNLFSKAAIVLLSGTLLGCGLTSDVTLEVFNLSVVSSPGQEGDLVSLNFTLTVLTSGSVGITAMIDDEAYSTHTAPRLFSDVFTWEIGDAGDLIERFGLGDHTARVQVHDPASDRTAISELVTFSLIAAAP